MPLTIEVQREGQWAPMGIIGPKDRPGSMSNITPDGQREMYIFECAVDDASSKISRSAGIDGVIDPGMIRVIITAHTEVVRVLHDGDFPFELSIHSDHSKEAHQIRFMHLRCQ